MGVPLTNYAGLTSLDLANLEHELADLSSLDRVLTWGRAQRPPRPIDEILTQDEYTHDVVMAIDQGRYLVFDTT
jgi:hypothetical protein